MDPQMKDETISSLRKFALEVRALLEKEINEQLEGIYGFLPEGSLESQTKYPALNELNEAKETRKRLEQYIIDEQSIGISSKEARDKLIRETAFTWLNRFVAFKMMETRKLIKETISRGPDSKGFKLWLTEPGNEKAYQKYEAGDFPQNKIGDGPRQEAYRRFLLSICKTLADEIHVLFDPENLQSRLFPRPRVLLSVFKYMNKDDLREAWEPGNDETIGWVYQFFNEEEKNNIFTKLNKEKKKISKEEIPAVTELFTPNWIVRWIVENSLGRYWIRMHPNSRLRSSLKYLVPIPNDEILALKPVSKITFLDPACGTMHFGLVAFDIFVKMYEEELDNAGHEGWPDTPSVNSKEEIGATIIGNNLFGIDIDLRAVQLSALSLFLRAKSINPSIKIIKSNLACADITNFNMNQIDIFFEQSGIRDSVLARVVKELCSHLQGIQNSGSLLRIETALEKSLKAEKVKYKKESEQPSLPELEKIKFEKEATTEQFWEQIEEKIIDKINEFIESQSPYDTSDFFVNEISKGIRFFDVLINRYDIVCTNPPYMSRRNMNNDLNEFLSSNYPYSKGDLYTAFIERCTQLISTKGMLGMITQQSFMFISSYEKMRRNLIDEHIIEAMVHLGPHAFDAISGEKVNTTMFVLDKETDTDTIDNSIGTYFRLIKEPDGKNKRQRFEEALSKLQNQKEDPIIYKYKQSDFDAIPGSPWVYWIPLDLRSLFIKLPPLRKLADLAVGLQTGDNPRFVRYWWEVGIDNIAFGIKSTQEAEKSGKKWFPYMKGGSFKKWYGNQDFIVNWHRNGMEIKSCKSSRPQNQSFYFRKGLTWGKVTSGGFSIRYSQGGFIFDVAGCSIFLSEDKEKIVLGLLNSNLIQALLQYISPTINYEKGHIESLPILRSFPHEIGELSNRAIELAKQKYTYSENSLHFTSPIQISEGKEKLNIIDHKLSEIQQEIDNIVYMAYGISTLEKNIYENDIKEIKLDEKIEPESIIDSQDNNKKSKHLGLVWISYAFGILIGRYEFGEDGGLGCGNFSEEINKQLIELSDPDGIVVMDDGHSDDITRKIIKGLTIIFGADETANIIRTATEKKGEPEQLLRDYLSTKFFKDHIKRYRKRPVYWFLQSPQKKYGIWIFHERFTKDTLFRIQSEYVAPKIKLLESQIEDFRAKRDSSEGHEQRKAEKEISRLTEILDDVREFSKRIKKITDRGYTHHIDDGVLINMAPLWELIPSWQSELKKAWQSLEKGDWDWSYQAMNHWPERVKEKCRKNKSYAIAHGLEDLYEGKN